MIRYISIQLQEGKGYITAQDKPVVVTRWCDDNAIYPWKDEKGVTYSPAGIGHGINSNIKHPIYSVGQTYLNGVGAAISIVGLDELNIVYPLEGSDGNNYNVWGMPESGFVSALQDYATLHLTAPPPLGLDAGQLNAAFVAMFGEPVTPKTSEPMTSQKLRSLLATPVPTVVEGPQYVEVPEPTSEEESQKVVHSSLADSLVRVGKFTLRDLDAVWQAYTHPDAVWEMQALIDARLTLIELLE